MALTIQLIDPNNPVSQGPSVINQNLTAIKAEMDSIESFLNPSSSTLKLTNLTTGLPVGGAEVATIVVTKNSGDVISVSPAGGALTFKVATDGTTTGLKFVASGTGGGDISTFYKATFADVVTVNAKATINGALDLMSTNSIVLAKYTQVTIANANTGASAVSPVDFSKAQLVYMDCYNTGSALSNSGQIKLDTTNMTNGQVIEVHLSRKNTGGQSFYNGTTGNEIFCYMNTNGSGITTISASTVPTFTPQAGPDSQSWIRLQWFNTGGSNYKFLVLDSHNVTGVS
jgi:hypothetical protein